MKIIPTTGARVTLEAKDRHGQREHLPTRGAGLRTPLLPSDPRPHP